ncbi:MAG: allophanate hydrolase [Chitinophagales bacterium]|nr:allophanate hydrolase [Hyphomicrobiales bacterium]
MLSLSFDALQSAYASGAVSPEEVVSEVYERINAAGNDGVWISRAKREDAAASARTLQSLRPEERARLPLYGLPFAVKDCIDVAGTPTTCACPDFAYLPQRSASAVERLIAAGAIYIGKTNMDQFATGLVGTRSPYGVARNPFNADYIPGGSSSGSAVAVAAGLVSFALGTDTGGSGRVPASYTNTVGLKPTVGKISPRGLVNACRSIDCISIYTLTGAEALQVLSVAQGYEPETPFSRPPDQTSDASEALDRRDFFFGVPDDKFLDFFGDTDTPVLFQQAVAAMELLGGRARRIDYAPMLEVNQMMFFGPLLAERFAAVGTFVRDNPSSCDPTVGHLIERAVDIFSVETWRMLYRLEEIKRSLVPMWHELDVLLTPTVGRLWTKADIDADPVGPNFKNGYYTNFVNPLDLCAVATPNGFARSGVPVGVCLVGQAHSEHFLCGLADRFSALRVPHAGAREMAQG